MRPIFVNESLVADSVVLSPLDANRGRRREAGDVKCREFMTYFCGVCPKTSHFYLFICKFPTLRHASIFFIFVHDTSDALTQFGQLWYYWFFVCCSFWIFLARLSLWKTVISYENLCVQCPRPVTRMGWSSPCELRRVSGVGSTPTTTMEGWYKPQGFQLNDDICNRLRDFFVFTSQKTVFTLFFEVECRDISLRWC